MTTDPGGSEDDERVKGQYEAFPYPAREPRDEKRRLITGSPSHPLEIDHYLFGGTRDWSQPFRALIAGGGTGDAAIMLAQGLADRGCPAEIVYLDISSAARAVAQARAAVRGLTNLRFVSGSLLEAPALGRFDYVDCCGVLHHLDDPQAGLAALARVLEPGGGIGLMVYGELGRTGVYPVQRALRTLAHDLPDQERVRLARRLLKDMPQTNWLLRNPYLGDHVGSDAGIYDLLLHSRDRAYRVPEVLALLAGAGLRLVTFIEPVRYDPATHLTDPALRRRLAGLDPGEAAALAEDLCGTMKTHVLYAAPVAAPPRIAAFSPDAIPVLRDLDGKMVGERLRPGDPLVAEFAGFTLNLPLPPLGPAMLARCDGKTSFAGLHAAMPGAPPLPAFLAQAEAVYRAMNGINRLLLRVPG